MEEVKETNNGKEKESLNALDSEDIFSNFDNSDEDTSSIFDAIMGSDISEEETSTDESKTETSVSDNTNELAFTDNSDANSEIPQTDIQNEVQDDRQDPKNKDTESQILLQKTNEEVFGDDFADLLSSEEALDTEEHKRKEDPVTFSTAGLDDDPFGDTLFAKATPSKAGIDSDNPFAELEGIGKPASIDDGNPFADLDSKATGNISTVNEGDDGNPFSGDGNPFAQKEKADRSNSPASNNKPSFFDDLGSPFTSTDQGSNQEDISIDDFLKSIS